MLSKPFQEAPGTLAVGGTRPLDPGSPRLGHHCTCWASAGASGHVVLPLADSLPRSGRRAQAGDAGAGLAHSRRPQHLYLGKGLLSLSIGTRVCLTKKCLCCIQTPWELEPELRAQTPSMGGGNNSSPRPRAAVRQWARVPVYWLSFLPSLACPPCSGSKHLAVFIQMPSGPATSHPQLSLLSLGPQMVNFRMTFRWD